jgi:hypothetical protein
LRKSNKETREPKYIRWSPVHRDWSRANFSRESGTFYDVEDWDIDISREGKRWIHLFPVQQACTGDHPKDQRF